MNTIETMELRLVEAEKRLAGQAVLIEKLWGILAEGGIDDDVLEARKALAMGDEMQSAIDAKKAFDAWLGGKDAT